MKGFLIKLIVAYYCSLPKMRLHTKGLSRLWFDCKFREYSRFAIVRDARDYYFEKNKRERLHLEIFDYDIRGNYLSQQARYDEAIYRDSLTPRQ